MAKQVLAAVLDAALDLVGASNRQVVCAGQPTSYADVTTRRLAEVALAGGDFTKAAGDVSGRKTTIAAKSAIAVTTSGTADHIALANSVNSTVPLITTCTSQAINTGGTVDIPAWKYEIQNPT